MKNIKGLFSIIIKLFLGFFLCALGMVFMLYADLGADSWTTFQKSISNISGISFGKISQLVGLVLIIINIYLKEPPGIATILNMYFVGFFMDIIEYSNILLTPSNFFVKLLFLILGMISLSIGIWLYLKNGLGAGPRDGLMIGLMRKFNFSVTIIKTSIDLTILVIGLLLGGPFGIGTFIATFGHGAVLDKTFQIAKFDSKNTYQRNLKDEWESIKNYREKGSIQEKHQEL